MDTIRLEFRRGGDWCKEKGKWYVWRGIGGTHLEVITGPGDTSPKVEYAELPPFEIVKPDPVPLRLNCDSETFVSECEGGFWQCMVTKFGSSLTIALGSGSTRREAIENFNYLARKMGAKEPE